MRVMERITKLMVAGVFTAFFAVSDVATATEPGFDVEDPFAVILDDGVRAKDGVEPGVTFSARNISLLEALQIICDLKGLRMEYRGNYLMLVDKNKPSSQLVRKSYEVNPELMMQLRKMTEAKRKQQDRFKRSDNPF